MGDVKIRYYVTRKKWPGSRARWGYWVPSPKMQAAGFSIVSCGVDGPAAWAIAQRWNERWDDVRTGRAENASAAKKMERVYPPGSLGDAFARFRATITWKEKAPRTREEWERAWKHIDPIFGDVSPAIVAFEDLDGWYAALRERIGIRESARAMKIWRSLWRVAAIMRSADGEHYCEGIDPSRTVRCTTPTPRKEFWFEGEAVRLVKGALRMGYTGLAAMLAVAWDTMLSPIDVRGLTLGRLKGDAGGPLFSTNRAKTGEAAIGTLSKRTQRLLDAYLASLPFELHPDTPIFHTRGATSNRHHPVPYSRPMMGDDFRTVRAAVFPGDKRQVLDFRRSGAVEATMGEVDPAALAGKMANSIDENRTLQATYQPKTAKLVRLADHARVRGRSRLRGSKGSAS